MVDVSKKKVGLNISTLEINIDETQNRTSVFWIGFDNLPTIHPLINSGGLFPPTILNFGHSGETEFGGFG